jgi:hypothetical protein
MAPKRERCDYGEAELDEDEQDFMDGLDSYDVVNVLGEWILPSDVLGPYKSRHRRGKMTHGQTIRFREELATMIAAVRGEILSWIDADLYDAEEAPYTPAREPQAVRKKPPRRKQVARKARRVQKVLMSSPESETTELLLGEAETDQLLAEIEQLEPDYDMYATLGHTDGQALVVD